MSIVLLISETALKQYTVINDNVDACYITPAIKKAQDMGLQPLIGTALYKKLCDLVTPIGNPPTMPIDNPANAAYKILLDDYVRTYLQDRTAVELVWNLFAKIRNNGIVTSNDQQTQQMSIGDCEYLRKKLDYDATFYANRMTQYLCANAALFPEYGQRECADMPANRKAYDTSIVL